MAIIYRGRVGGNYQYWNEDQSVPMGATNITVVNVPVLTASHVDRSVYAPAGISGSLQRLTGSQAYLIAGPNITVTTNSLGQIEITGSAGGGGGGFGTLQQTYDAGVATIGVNNSTGSFVMSGGLTPVGSNYPPLMRLEPGKGGPYYSNYNAIDILGIAGANSASLINIRGNSSTFGDALIMMRSTGDAVSKLSWFSGAGELYGSTGTSEIYYHPNANSLTFHVAGSGRKYIFKDSSGAAGTDNVAEFINATTSYGGSVRFFTGTATNATFFNYGSFEQSGLALFKNNVEVTGSVTAKLGFSGSLTKLADGTSYIIAGSGVTVSSASNGAITISATGGGGGNPYWQSTTNNVAFTTGSIEVTGSVTLGVDGAGRGLLRVGTLDISPITGSASTTVGTNNAILSGSVLSASNGVWDGSNSVALRHEFHVLAIGYDTLGNLNQFAATYLASTHINAAGSQTAIQNGLTEMSRETTGSYTSGWDVNVNTDCSLAVTGATDTGNVYWYVQRIKEMGLRQDGTRI